MMLSIEQLTHRTTISTSGWRLVSEYQQDRWEQRLELLQPSIQDWQTQWSSIEGVPADFWPVSPAFQDLFCESVSPTCAELQLLGQAGKTHFSTAIRVDALNGSIDYDVAARTKLSLGNPWLGSTIQFPAGTPVQLLGQQVQGQDWSVEYFPIEGQATPAWHWNATKGELQLQAWPPTIPANSPGVSSSRQQTIRWQYQFRLTTRVC